MEELVFSTEKNTYSYYERKSSSDFTRICIDGTVTGCGKCVGYCRCVQHPGFLTAKHVLKHECIKKQCDHFIKK